MESYFRLSQSAVERLAEKYGTPVLVVSTAQVEANYRFLQQHLPKVQIYYAMKANPESRIVETMARLGSSFDVASDGEMLMLQSMGINGERMIYANPVKTESGFRAARKSGVRRFTFDSASEIYKMARAVPGGTVLLRIRIENKDSHVDLNKKFGASPEDAMELLRLAREQGLDVAGLCFHVGSQCVTARPYLESMKVCRKLFDEAAAEGMNLRVLDIGGGYPIPVIGEELDLVGLVGQIREGLEQYFPDTEIWAEPGRFICGTAMNLVTRVIGTQNRDDQQWYFLDDGLYGTFSGIIFDHWDFELVTFKSGDMIPAVFAGPSCDSLDILFRDKMTVPLAVDDLILVPVCGAYTSASSTVFNGFAKTQIVCWEEVRSLIEQ